MALPQKLVVGARRLVRSLFPARCAGCEAYLKQDLLACERCRNAVFTIEGPLCLICGQPRPVVGAGYAGVDDICGQCTERRPRFERARARWEYSGTIAEALQRAKYRGELWAIRSLASELRPWLDEQLAGHADATITAVPMHPSDLRRRGFNAALLLARRALRGRRVHDNIVTKTKKTPAQAGLARGQRLVNLRGAFSCRSPQKVDGKTVVIFDDVMTTGATTSEVAKTLRRAGARRVEVLAAARAVADRAIR